MSSTKQIVPEGTASANLVGSSHGRLSIASVERDTGIPKETLRVWERRYGFPAPMRDAQDDRVYSAEDLEKLRLVRRLIAIGHRPGKILNLDLQDLVVLSTDPAGEETDDVRHALGLLVANDVDRFEAWLATALARDGLKSFVLTTAPGLTVAVGEAWARGKLQIHHEHIFSEIITRLLRTAISATPSKARAPRVLLTTFPLEPHTIGLLMAEAMFALSGCSCISLGPQTPVPDIAMAAGAHRADIVALSFSKTLAANRVTQGLMELRGLMPQNVAIWAGGASESLGRVKSADILVLRDLEKIPEAVSAWRAALQSA